jgi:protein phosphatase PTC7
MLVSPSHSQLDVSRPQLVYRYPILSTLTQSVSSFIRNALKPSTMWAFWIKPNTQQQQPQQNPETQQKSVNATMIAAGYCLSKKARVLQDVKPHVNENVNNSYDCGEDAYFVDQHALGVADGVGSWSNKGVDPGEIARKLMINSRVEINNGENDPRNALAKAYNTIVTKKQVKAGSSTACVLNLSNGKLTTANLGDSGFILLRPFEGYPCEYEIIYKSPEQQVYFNCPKQLSVVPPETPNARNYIQSNPKEADKQQFDVQDGDLIICATDGLFDNLYNHQILKEASETCRDVGENYQVELARRLVIKARRVATDRTTFQTPFSDNASRNGYPHRGGKPDDITCVVARITVKKQ